MMIGFNYETSPNVSGQVPSDQKEKLLTDE